MRRQGIRTVFLAAVTAVGLGSPNAHAEKDFGSWRLFDLAPLDRTASSRAPTDELPRQERKQSLPKSRAPGHWLVFNGIVSSSLSAGQVGNTEPVETLWINGYPYQESVLLHVVSQVIWHKDRQVLEVQLSNGLVDYLSPGERIPLDKEQ